MTKEKLSKKAMKEAYTILIHLDEEELNKIPKNMMNTFKNLGDKSYVVDFETLIEGNLMQETQDILCYIYYKFLASDEDKKMIDDFLSEINILKAKKRQNVQNKETKSINEKLEPIHEDMPKKVENLPTVINSSNLFIRIWNRIKKIFNIR